MNESTTSSSKNDSATTNNGKNEFTTVEVVRDPDGVIATITKRERDGRISFSISREFEQDGRTKQTAFLARRHLPAVRRLLDDLEERLELAEDRARARKRDR